MPFDAITEMSPADEKRCAKALSPPVAWPTLALAVLLPLAQWTVVGLGAARLLPFWACAPIVTLAAYAHYTLVHESIHGNLVPGHPRLRWLNDVVGWVGALGLSHNWPIMMRGHALHHAHTNTDQDPDIHVKGALSRLLAKWLVFVPMSLVPQSLLRFIAPAQYRKLERTLRPGEMLQGTAVSLAILALLALSIATGRFLDWLCLLFIPTRVAALILQICFSWLPHHPFDRTERYLNTRISLWPGAGLLLLQQNLHLMHHLWPSVPFYNYGRLYRRLRPVLIAKGSPIQGLLVGRFAKDRSLTSCGPPSSAERDRSGR
jgi:fatty acid desaturase